MPDRAALRSRRLLLVALAVDNVGSGLFLPLALLYATRVVGLGVDVAGVAVALASLLGFAVPPVAGRLSQQHGPRAVVIWSQLVQAAGALGYLVANDVVTVFVGAALLSIGTQLFYCAVFVLIADVSESTAKERPYALVGMVRAGAFGLGNLIAALVLTQGSEAALRVLVGLDAATFVVAAALLTAVRPAHEHHPAAAPIGTRAVLADHRYRLLMLGSCMTGLVVDVALLGTPVFVIDVLAGPGWLAGTLIATGTALSSVFGVAVVDALRHHRRTRALQLAAVLYAGWALAFPLVLWLPAAWLVPWAFAAWLLLVLANKITYPMAAALSEALPPTEARAAYMATYQYAYTTAQVLAPGVVALFAVTDWLPFAVVAAAATLAVGLAGRLGTMIPAGTDRPRVTVSG